MYILFVLQNVFREVFGDDALAIRPESSSKDIDGWDSVAQVKLVLAIEEEFGIQFTEDEVSSIRTVGGFLEAIERHNGQAL